MTDQPHRHPRCITPASGAAVPAVDLAAVEALRGRVAELEAERIRWAERVVTLETRNAALEKQVDELMCWTVGAYVEEELDAERSAAFGKHLAKCEACQSQVAHLIRIAGLKSDRTVAVTRNLGPIAIANTVRGGDNG